MCPRAEQAEPERCFFRDGRREAGALPRNTSGAGSSAATERPLETRKHLFTWNSVSILPKKACIYKDRDNSLFAFRGLFPGLGKK